MNKSLGYNRLKQEKSLYLKQHQDNPIHWWPWGPEALLKAKEENRPILLSIGYSSCHWCHTMSHETFENLDVAEFLNKNFIAIKIDREEYPDIDSYYQQAAHMFGRNGGWPLNVFLLPDLRPFFAGTYFPPISSKEYGPSFLEISKELSRAFSEQNEQVLENAEKVFAVLTTGPIIEEKVEFQGHFPPPQAILEATKEVRDLTYGGFGKAPKFPQLAFYEWAVEQILEGMVSKENGEFIVQSVEKMLMGGIHDHARGGIHRYSTDEKWLIPHFEKMLYDQAGLLKLLSKISMVYPSPLFLDAIINTLEYLDSEMIGDENYFFSSQDADSEGVEGLFFCFSEAEFEDAINSFDTNDDQELLSKNIEQIKKWFNITTKGNFDHSLNVISLNSEFKNEMYEQKNWDLIRKVRKIILNDRKNRMPPTTDNKGIASWNFMMITALTDIIQYSQIEIIKRMATNILNKVLDPILKTFIVQNESGMRLRHVTTMELSHPYLEDFVTFAESQLRMYEISANPVFKQNFSDVLNFITREFLDSDRVLTRARFSNDHELYPNIESSLFDNSYKSLVSTYIQLMKRAHILFGDRDYLDSVRPLEERMTQIVLKMNPLGAGEALRALTYPNEVYRVIKVPRTWIQNEKFINFLPYFLPRFVIDYTEDNFWQICNFNACELKGTEVEEFITSLAPQTDNGEQK